MLGLSGRCYLSHEDLLVELREAVILEEERRLTEAVVVPASLQQVSQLILAQLVPPVLQRVLIIELLDLVPHLTWRHDRWRRCVASQRRRCKSLGGNSMVRPISMIRISEIRLQGLDLKKDHAP